jgi:RND family efflux transporter MFP subunit
LTRTQAEAELAGVTYERLAQLQSSEPLAVTSQNVDVARAERSVAQARVASASAEIDLARAMVSELKTMMDYAFIRAPFAGVVTRRDVDRGELVVSGDDGGVSVLEVTRMDRLRLVLAVPEQIVPMTRVGMMVRVRVDALPQSSFKASVSRLTGALRMDTRTMRVEIDMGDEDGRLRPGMYALVQLELDVEPDALSIPASLVQRESGGIFVWTVHDGVARKTPIEVVRDDGDRAVIRAELDSGATLVVGAPADLAEGQQVRIVQSEASQ